ncbi:MAG: hypothetical protein WBL05_12950 [Brooklawnia sp.]|uniref:hypothetical protein n=1 Tax=Brooklawnia sp. TaxID=2699740 RepID=UPI003C74CFFB
MAKQIDLAEGGYAELDYATLATFARINADGTLTILDAGFLRLVIMDPALPVDFAIAGRIRFRDGARRAEMKLVVSTPGGMRLELVSEVEPALHTEYGDGRSHAMLAFNTQMAPGAYGEAEILIYLDGVQVRRLVFEFVPVG